jgi:Insulin-like growth factor binding protein
MMRKSIVVISLLVILFEITAAQTVLDECGQCHPENCPSTSNCLAGGYRDKCGCCVVCGRLEGEKCDNYTLPLPQKDQYGFCGDQMVCLLRKDLEKTVIHSEFRSSFFHAFVFLFSTEPLKIWLGGL